jgi:hypothetical protein
VTSWKFGLHLHQNVAGYARDVVNALAAEHRLAGAMLINDVGWANYLADCGVPYVAVRPVNGEGDGIANLYGDERDQQRGLEEWHRTENQRAHNDLHPAVILIPFGSNEQGYSPWFFLGIQMEALKQQRSVGIFSDAVANPGQMVRVNGTMQPHPVWKARVESGCMRFAKQHGNFYIRHNYGRMIVDEARHILKPTNDPGSALWMDDQYNVVARDDEAFYWFGGAHQPIYRDLVPEDSRVDILVGECGASSADFEATGGIGGFLKDNHGYGLRYGPDPYVKAWMYWTFGNTPPFGYSCADPAAPALLSYARHYKP